MKAAIGLAWNEFKIFSKGMEVKAAERLATFDDLTSALNRRAFMKRALPYLKKSDIYVIFFNFCFMTFLHNGQIMKHFFLTLIADQLIGAVKLS